MADATAQARQQVQKDAEAKTKSVEEAYSTMGKPTPTQEENDLFALGVPMDEHEDDGSGPEAVPQLVRTKQSEAKPTSGGGSYTTRSAAATPPGGKEHSSGSKST